MNLPVKNPAFGYYTVGNKIYTSKVAALIEGTKINTHPEWVFNNHIFDVVDWTIEPSESLNELYRIRAQELRDRYDYLVLAYSAGSDSQTILDVCLQNNIKIDEVVVSWAKSLDKTYTPNTENIGIDNMLSEWDFTIKPRLDWLAANHPEIKITIHDWAKDILNVKVEDNFIEDRNHNFSMYAGPKWDFYHSETIAPILEKKNIGLILGIDKPRICFHEGAYRLFFLDISAQSAGPQYCSRLLQDELSVEFFYWNPACTKILAKQAHALVKFFETVPQLKTFITWPISNPKYRQFYEMISRAVIYPELDLNFFQAEKAKTMNFANDGLLFPLGIEQRMKVIQKENFDYLQKIIDKKYFITVEGEVTLTGFIMGMYPIKTVDQNPKM